MPAYTLSPQSQADDSHVAQLMDAAFGPQRYARTVYRFRDGVAPLTDHSFVAYRGGELVGSIRFWPVLMPDGTSVPMLGPLAVQPELRGLGIGRELVETGLASVKETGTGGVLIVGDAGYYAPFGFAVDVVQNLDLGGAVVPLTLMGLEYTDGVFSSAEGRITPAYPNTSTPSKP